MKPCVRFLDMAVVETDLCQDQDKVYTKTVFVYCYPEMPKLQAYMNSIGWAACAIWAVTKKHSLILNVITVSGAPA